MKNFRRCFTLAFILINVVSCNDDQEVFSSGTYHYSGYDLEGQKVTAGDITIEVDNSLIEGDKNIEIVGTNVQNVTDAGSGLIGGQIAEDGEIIIYLLEAHGPYMLIRGKYNNGVLKGKRYWGSSGGAPEVVIGYFTARGIE